MDFIVDAVLDSLKVLPFLFLVYLLINYLEQNKNNTHYGDLIGKKGVGPIIGSLIGCMPQCGFSVVGANLYSKRLISLGTLIAIFISTSDEAVPILFANPGMLREVGLVLAIKVILAIIIGVTMDVLITRKGHKEETKSASMKNALSHAQCSYTCCHTNGGIWKSTLVHTFKVFMYILVINLILNGIIEAIGEESLGQILLANSVWQPALAALVGLIPNCAASIVLTEMYIAGSLSFGGLIAGLSTGAGIGLVVLFKANKSLKENLKIVGLLYILGTAAGMLIQLVI